MNWFRSLVGCLKGQSTAAEYARLRLAKLREVEKWEASSPTTVYVWQTQRRCRRSWTYLDIDEPSDSRQMPNWLKQAARRVNVRNKGPRFYHRRFITYRVEYDDVYGLMIFKGLKPSRLVKMELRLRRLRK